MVGRIVTSVDWEPLREANPVPGDPFAVQDLARHFGERAATIDDAIRRLESLDTGDLQSSAVTELRRLRDELLPDLRHLEVRYQRTADALWPYCNALERAQGMARDALAMARAAEGDIAQAEAGAEELRRQVREMERIAQETGRPPTRTISRDWTAALDDAEGRMAAAERLCDEAEELYNDAARNCANAIEDAGEDDLRNDGGFFGAVGEFFEDVREGMSDVGGWAGDRWEDATNWVGENWPSLEEWSSLLGYVSAGLGIAALIPGMQFLAPLAAIAGGAKLLIDIHLYNEGRQGFGEVALGAVGLLTFGVGRVFTAAARGTAGAKASVEASRLAAKTGPGSLKGVTATIKAGNTTRTIYGAAARSHKVSTYNQAASAFGTHASTKMLPRMGHYVEAFSKWNMSPPSNEILRLSPLAVRMNRVALVSSGVGTGFDADQMLGEPVGRPMKKHVFGDAPRN